MITELVELEEVVQTVLENLRDTSQDGAVVLGLRGDLGAGKTTCIQLLAKELYISETVTSPTFVVMKAYEAADRQFQQLVHIDAYRIETVDEMRVLHFDALLAQSNTIICIEWPEHITPLLPPHTAYLDIVMVGAERHITFTYE